MKTALTLAMLAALATACHRTEPAPASFDAAPPSPASPAPMDPVLEGCGKLVGLALPHARVLDARIEPASPPSGWKPALPERCLAGGIATPTADSVIRFEVVIPVGAAWNGRYRQLGNGGFAGRIPEDDIVAAVGEGDAAAGTDDGHESERAADASWALGHPEKVVDFGYRAVKETHDAALAVITSLTGRAPAHTYFEGCSDGGREALMEAERYPDDFDGIVAGAPAAYATHLLLHWASNELALMKTAASYLPAQKLPAVQAAALKACGDADGVVEEPLACKFDPAVLRCAGAETDACLTGAQIATLRALYSPLKNPRTGALIEPGFEPGAEAEDHAWADWILGKGPGAAGNAVQWRFASSFFRSMVFGDAGYDLARLDFDRDVATADAKVGTLIDSGDPDLARFKARGGKLIQFHGWSDGVVPPRDSIRYFESVRARMGETGDFYRLFMAPGMLHCDGGRGPNVLATSAAIRAWVEQGTAPERVLASKYAGNDARKALERTRPLCPYPQVARWSGQGDREKAESWGCAGEGGKP